MNNFSGKKVKNTEFRKVLIDDTCSTPKKMDHKRKRSCKFYI